MLDKQHRHIKIISYKADSIHKLRCFVWIHAGSRLVKKQQLRLCCKSSCDLKLSLIAVWKSRSKQTRLIVKLENLQKLQRLCVHCLFNLEISWKSENACKGAVFIMIVKCDLDVVKHRHILKKSDVLECTGNACTVYFDSVFAGDVLSVKNDCAVCWLINACEHIEDSGLSCSVRPNKTIELTFFYCYAELVNCSESAE